MSEAISLRVPNLQAKARKVVKQIETSRSPDPIVRRPCADRGEKRGPAGATDSETMTDQEQLDLNDPTQRRLLVQDWIGVTAIEGRAAFIIGAVGASAGPWHCHARETDATIAPADRCCLATAPRWRGRGRS